MDQTVEVSLPVEAEVAGSLADARTRDAVGRVVSRMLKPTREFDPLLAAMSALSAEAPGTSWSMKNFPPGTRKGATRRPAGLDRLRQADVGRRFARWS